MKRLICVALLAGASITHAQTASSPAVSAAKKDLVQKILAQQQPGIESLARNLVEQPAVQLMQGAGQALQTQVSADKREAAGKSIEADIKKFVDDSVPLAREHALKLAPSTIGTVLEEKFSDEELKQLLVWLDSPLNKKYQQLGPEMQNGFMQKLVTEMRPLLDPKVQALELRIRTTLGVPTSTQATPPAKATAPARKASGSK